MDDLFGCLQATDGSIVSAYVREAVRRAEEERPGEDFIGAVELYS
jgi:hypothetical protein